MPGCADRIRSLTGWRRLAAAFGAGALSVLALAPFDLWPLLFATLPVLLLLLDGAAGETVPRRRFFTALQLGWAFGFGYFLFGLYWIGKAFLVDAEAFAVLMPFAMTLMPAGLALFHGLAAAAAVMVWRPGLPRLVGFATAMALAEWLRGHILTGFPWNMFGNVFAAEAGLSQLASLFGPNALSLLAVLVFAAPVLALDQRHKGRALGAAIAPAVAALALLAASLWGHARLAGAEPANQDGIRLRIVQPNIEQGSKWNPGNAGAIYRTMLSLSGQPTSERPDGLAGVTHLVWPETALPFFMANSREALDGIAELLPDHTRLITGALRYETIDTTEGNAENRVYNSLMVLDGHARIEHTFDKKHLVPFGEYLPFQNVLEAIGLRQLTKIRGGFTAGSAHRLVKLDGAPAFAPLICYEVVFPEEVVEPGERPGWLVNVTNDAWYGVSTGPYQHLAEARIRAIETGLPLVRAANTGISAVIDPYGRIVGSLPLAGGGVIDAVLPAALPPTFYARNGELLFVLLIALSSAYTFYTGRNSQFRRDHAPTHSA